MHYYTFNVGDYRRDTAHLSRLEHSIYRDLIDWYYLDEKPIPLETQSVTRRLRLATEDEEVALKNVLLDFFDRCEDGYRHARIDHDIAKYHHECEKNRANGKKGGRPKSLQHKEKNPVGSQSQPTANPNESQINPNQEPITNNQLSTPPISPKGDCVDGDASQKKKSSRRKAVTFAEWIADVRAKGEKAVSDYQTVWNYANDLKLPHDFIELAWFCFKNRFSKDEKAMRKRYVDWRLHFLNYVKRNYMRLWVWSQKDSTWVLTSTGVQARMEAEAAA